MLATVLAVWVARSGVALSALALLCCAAGVLAARRPDEQRERLRELRRELEQLTALWQRERSARQLLQVAQRQLLEQLPAPARSLELAVDEAVAGVLRQRSWAELGRSVLDVLAEHGAVQTAALFVTDAASGELLEPPVAQLGAVRSAASDRLVQRAWRSAKLAMPANPASLSSATANVLAALPLASEGRVIGVIAVQHLAFEAFEPQRLQELTLVLQPIAAAIARASPLAAAREGQADVVQARWGAIA